MIYLLVLIASAAGIVLLFLIRSTLQSHNVRRIVRAVRRGFSSYEERKAHMMHESALRKIEPVPRNSVAHLQQVRTLLRKAERALLRRDGNTAERTLIHALTLQPEARDVKIMLARLYLDTSRAQKAEVLYRELLCEAQEPSLLAYMGLACMKQRKFEEAREAYAEALRLKPRDPHYAGDLGRAHMALRRFEEAAALFERALESAPRDMNLLHLLGQCYMQSQEPEKAEETYRRINRLEPGNEDVKGKIAALAGTSCNASPGA
jgi:cytochrome c-type biogenesis protein CcmH/NrfG